MNMIHIGEVLHRRRCELGYSQEFVAQGICETATLSRIENGVCTPSKSKMEALMQRLGLYGEKYVAYVSKSDIESDRLREEIIHCNSMKLFEEGLLKLEQLKSITSPKDHLMQQFILRSQVILGKMENGIHVSYSPEKQLALLLQAAHLTMPHFDINSLQHGLLIKDEIKIINQIAVLYSEKGEHTQAINIYRNLLKNIDTHCYSIEELCTLISMITYNYSRLLCLEKKPMEALILAEKGRHLCITYGRHQSLPGLLVVMADCYCQLGEIEKSHQLFLQSYYTYLATDDKYNAQVVKEHCKELLGLEI